MSPAELLEALLALARELDLEVRHAAPHRSSLARGSLRAGRLAGLCAEEPLADDAASGVCRLRGRVWVVLSGGDPVERRIAVVAAALRDHAADACERRYLPPAVRAALEVA